MSEKKANRRSWIRRHNRDLSKSLAATGTCNEEQVWQLSRDSRAETASEAVSSSESGSLLATVRDDPADSSPPPSRRQSWAKRYSLDLGRDRRNASRGASEDRAGGSVSDTPADSSHDNSHSSAPLHINPSISGSQPKRPNWIQRYSFDFVDSAFVRPSTKSSSRPPSRDDDSNPARLARRKNSVAMSDSGDVVSTPTVPHALDYVSSTASVLITASQQSAPDSLERITSSPSSVISSPPPSVKESRSSGSFGKIALNSVIGGLSALSLTRTSTNDDKERGRSKDKRRPSFSIRSASAVNNMGTLEDRSVSRARTRSQSPFSIRPWRSRDSSPNPQPLPLGDGERDSLSEDNVRIRPRGTAYDEDSETETENMTEDEGDESEAGEVGEDVGFDSVTERNTEQNAQTANDVIGDPDAALADDYALDPDPLGEGVNVVVPPEPYFPTTLNSSRSGGSKRGKIAARRRRTRQDPLPCQTSRPVFQRDRCTITITQGIIEEVRENRRARMYVVASDLSDESRYAVEWGIGTVLRDGDHMLIVTVMENEAKVDPSSSNAGDRSTKIRNQQERQGMAYILARQAISLLQRTHLSVVIECQAWHAKNSRHMLLDIVDYNEPTMLIVGSRGVGQLKGILLGSTSHYLIQRCSVPVMVARRRLKRPPRHSAHLAKHRRHVSLAEAGIDRVAARVDQDVATMRDEIQRSEDRRDDANRLGMGGRESMEEDPEGEEDGEEEGEGSGKSTAEGP